MHKTVHHLDKFHIVRIKAFCASKKAIEKMKGQPTEQEKTSAGRDLKRDLYLDDTENSYNSRIKKPQLEK